MSRAPYGADKIKVTSNLVRFPNLQDIVSSQLRNLTSPNPILYLKARVKNLSDIGFGLSGLHSRVMHDQ